jgi:hypothetical protein
MKKLSNALEIGAAFERLSFFLLVLFLVCHLFGCLWVFIGRNLQEEDESWI